MERPYQICTRCIMDTTDPDIEFDEQGMCNHCKSYDNAVKRLPQTEEEKKKVLDKIINEIKEKGKGKEYDCIVGLSGGVDSSHVALKVKEFGLRPLAVHFDSGWNSELAVNNIENIVKKLGFDLYTHVVDWDEMRDLQLSFFKASVQNCDDPQDHSFVAALYKLADERDIRYMISGYNLATESILPRSWANNSIDLKSLKAIQKIFGTVKLKSYPQLGIYKRLIYYRFIKKIKGINILDYLHYNKNEAKEFLKTELSWRDYGGKHYESKFTRFFQAYYLPTKFGFDKRRAHLSSLIVSGQIIREQALDELKKELYPEKQLQEDKEFVCKKLGITESEFEQIMARPIKTYNDYPTNHNDIIFKFLRLLSNKKVKF